MSNEHRPIDDAEQLVSDGLMTIDEAAEFLGIGRSSIYTLMESGELAFVRPTRRSRRIPRRAVLAYAAAKLSTH